MRVRGREGVREWGREGVREGGRYERENKESVCACVCERERDGSKKRKTAHVLFRESDYW